MTGKGYTYWYRVRKCPNSFTGNKNLAPIDVGVTGCSQSLALQRDSLQHHRVTLVAVPNAGRAFYSKVVHKLETHDYATGNVPHLQQRVGGRRDGEEDMA